MWCLQERFALSSRASLFQELKSHLITLSKTFNWKLVALRNNTNIVHSKRYRTYETARYLKTDIWAHKNTHQRVISFVMFWRCNLEITQYECKRKSKWYFYIVIWWITLNIPSVFKITWFFRLGTRLKGTVSRDFLFLVFFMNQFPPSPRVSQ